MYIDFVNSYDVKIINTYEKLKSNGSFMGLVGEKHADGHDLVVGCRVCRVMEFVMCRDAL